MCGIAGIVRWDGPDSQETVKRMLSKLAHRGPDGSGIEQDNGVCFGHRRLAIVDLSEAARQPMWDTTERYLITFNGEIYNFPELKQELEKLGAQFQSRSDTEVILEAYKEWGEKCVQRFNGMFAFALWDRKARTLFMARDRLGKKPLYYVLGSDHSIVFSSELGSLLECSVVPRSLNLTALSHYLALGYVTSSECIYAGVRKLPAACTLVITPEERPRVAPYWDLASRFYQKSSYQDEREAAQALSDLLDDAVKIRQISDVPLGAFLSGGLDSSAVVASMKRMRGSDPTHSFSIGFSEPSFSELEYAESVAQHLGVMHQSQIVTEDETSFVPFLAQHMCEPFADTSMIPMYLLSAFTRKHVTVALSGDGADEIFAGYETYAADRLHAYARHVPHSLLKIGESVYRRLKSRDFGKVSRDFKILQFLKGCAQPFPRSHYSWRELFTDDEKKSLLRQPLHDLIHEAHPAKTFAAFDQEVQDCAMIDRAMYIDIKTWLVDDILVKVDRTSMATSLEVRAPFLDYRMVEFAAALPVPLKIRGMKGKYVLRESQRAHLPPETLTRQKRGFNSPISFWLFSTLRPACEAMLAESWIFEYVDRAYVKRLLQEHLMRVSDNSFKLFTLLCLHYWNHEQAGTLSNRRAA